MNPTPSARTGRFPGLTEKLGVKRVRPRRLSLLDFAAWHCQGKGARGLSTGRHRIGLAREVSV
jgi:hypothetical protein